MAIISILIALGVDRLFEQAERWRRPEWLHGYRQALARRLSSWRYWDGPAGVLVVVALPLVVLALVFWLLGGIGFGLLGALLGIAVLYFSLGPRDLSRQVRDYLRLSTENTDASLSVAAAVTRGDRPESQPSAHAAVRDGVFTEANERLFGVLFWFMILGPVGALLYRLADELQPADDEAEDAGFDGAANRLHGILAWPSARLAALTYGLVGSFEDALAQWHAHHGDSGGRLEAGNRTVLVHSGRGAIRLDPDCPDTTDDAQCVAAALDLYHRSVAVWLILLAVLTLAGWLT